MKKRMRNPYFWIGIIGIVLTAMGVSADTLTSWDAVYAALLQLIHNPYMIGSVIIALVGVFVDPSSKGLLDSKPMIEREDE